MSTRPVLRPVAVPAAAFATQVRVYYEDTDAAGIVYYANYLRFMERARTEWLRAHGYDIEELARLQGVLFAVRAVEVEYSRPARLSDLLVVTVAPRWCRRASLAVVQEIRRGAERLCSGTVTLACLDASSLAPRPIPPPLRDRMNATETP